MNRALNANQNLNSIFLIWNGLKQDSFTKLRGEIEIELKLIEDLTW